MIINTLLYGGDRWFVYALFIIFLLLTPVRSWLKNIWVDLIIISILIVIYLLNLLPSLFALKKVFLYMVFFITGYMIRDWYTDIKSWSLKNWWLIYSVFILFNLAMIEILCKNQFIFKFILPLIGTLAVSTMAFQLEKVIERSKVAQYIEYCGKYSLQFYLFTFCYPLIRWGIVSVLHITNPIIILVSVFVLQIITSTIIVEITRKIKWLKIPCGY